MAAAKQEITQIRERWAALTNEKLHEHGLETRVDHRSLEDQGVEREPTSHLGPSVSAMERRGIETEVGKRLGLRELALAQQQLDRAAQVAARQEQEMVTQLRVVERDALSEFRQQFAQERYALQSLRQERDQELQRTRERERDGPELER